MLGVQKAYEFFGGNFSFFFKEKVVWKKNDGILQMFSFEKSKESGDL